MPQLSLYIDKDTLKKVEKAANNENISLSKWVKRSIEEYLDNHWPSDFFSLFGSIQDDSFFRPEQQSFTDDSTRENL